MDLLVRAVLLSVIGLAYAYGPLWSQIGILILYPVASEQGKKTYAYVCIFYAFALIPAAVAGLDYTGSVFWTLFVWLAPLALNTLLIGFALSQREQTIRAICLLMVLVVLAIPPLSSVAVISPAHVAGILFPGTEMVGLVILAVLIVTVCLRWSVPLFGRALTIIAICTSAAVSHVYTSTFIEKPRTPRIVGINTFRGMPDADTASLYRAPWRFEELEMASNSKSQGVIFPESSFGDWNQSDGDILSLSETQIIGGARIDVAANRYVNVLIRGDTGEIVYAQKYPIPLGFGQARQATGSTKGIEISNNGIDALICIEIGNTWQVVNTFARAKGAVVWAANLGWSTDERLHRRLNHQLQSWSRLFNTPVVTAVNHREKINV